MQLILIAGQAGVGKTTLAQTIAEVAFSLGLIPRLLSFAGPLKKLAASKGYDKDKHPEKYREFCQAYGARFREETPNHWVKEFKKDYEAIEALETEAIEKKKKFWEHCVIVDDCRYPNELRFGIDRKASLIFLSYGDREMEDPDGEWRDHHSEEMAKAIDAGSDKIRNVFTSLLRNQDDLESFRKKATLLVPLWCGVQPEAAENEVPFNVSVSGLIDLLLLGNLDDEDEDDEEEA